MWAGRISRADFTESKRFDLGARSEKRPIRRMALDCASPLALLDRTPSDEEAAGDCRSPRRCRAKREFTTSGRVQSSTRMIFLDRPKPREVLDCASLLALLDRTPADEKAAED